MWQLQPMCVRHSCCECPRPLPQTLSLPTQGWWGRQSLALCLRHWQALPPTLVVVEGLRHRLQLPQGQACSSWSLWHRQTHLWALQAEQNQRPSDAQNKQDQSKAEQQQETAMCLGATQQAPGASSSPELQGQQAGAFCTHAAPFSAATTTHGAPHDPGEVKVQPAKGASAEAATARAVSMPRASTAAQEVTSRDLQREDRRRERSSSGDESHPLVPTARQRSGGPGVLNSPKVRGGACCE